MNRLQFLLKRRKRQAKAALRIKDSHVKSRYLLITSRHLASWIMLILVISILAYAWFSDILKINYIVCEGPDSQLCDSATMAELEQTKGKHTFLIQTRKLELKLKNAHPLYSSVVITPILPNTLKVNIDQTQSTTNLMSATNSAVLVIDKAGKVVDQRADPIQNIPKIISQNAAKLSIGDTISDSGITTALKLASALSDNYLPFMYLIADSNQEVKAIFPTGQIALFTGVKDIDGQARSLQLILSKATISPAPLVIDLRFEHPVLKYE